MKEYITEDISRDIDEINLTKNNKININKATQKELEVLSGIGPATAQKIVDYRTQNGEFTNIEEIKKVPGIGDVLAKKILNAIG